MKKIVIFSTAILLFLSFFTTSFIALSAKTDDEATPEYTLGDIDGSGEIDSTDYLKIKNTFLSKLTLKGTELALADVNFDGEIDSTDYLGVKESFLKDTPLDDSQWAEYEGKEKFTAISQADEFKVQFERFALWETIGNINEYVDPQSSTKAVLHYQDWFEEYYSEDDFSYSPDSSDMVLRPENIEVELPSGETVEAKFRWSDVTSYGSFVFRYHNEANGYWFLNQNKEIVGIRLFSDFLETNKDRSVKDDSVLQNIGLEKANSLFGDKGFKFQSYSTSGSEKTFRYTRYINNIATTDYVTVTLNQFGDIKGYFYHDTGLDKYDLRSFNVNDDYSLYYDKVMEVCTNLISNEALFDEFWSYHKDKAATTTICMDEPVFGISKDGKIAGFAKIRFVDENNYEYQTELIGFHAFEK